MSVSIGISSANRGPYALARLLCNLPLAGDDALEVGEPYLSVITSLETRGPGESALDAFRRALTLLPPETAADIQNQVFAIDPAFDPAFESRNEPSGAECSGVESSRTAPSEVSVPDLPPDAAVADLPSAENVGVGQWLDEYFAFASASSPRTPQLFHTASGLWVAGLAIARRVGLALGHGTVFPNQYTLLVAPTTLYAKTTGMRPMLRLIEAAIPHLLLPHEVTPEAFITELAGQEPTGLQGMSEPARKIWLEGRNFAAQRGLALDEASALFTAQRRDYLAGLLELFLRFYDGPERYSRHTRGGGVADVRSASLSFIGATTFRSLDQPGVRSAWDNGLFARFALLTPDAPPVWKPAVPDVAVPSFLVDTLRRLSSKLLPIPTWPAPPSVRNISITAQAFQAYQHYDRALTFDLLTNDAPPDERLWGTYGRMPTQALKLAVILATLDWATGDQQQLIITPSQWARAQSIAEAWRASAHRLLAGLDQSKPADRLEERVLAIVRQQGTRGATLREVYRALHARRDQIEPLLYGLARDAVLERFSPAGARAERFREMPQGGATA